mmetsp:Transcript_25062/g.31382  ORF Transcript_25062/g.31382 Transcript_25062/m.31382 type:complete len:170 (-) Transcript_25062:1742-2251(-)
MSISSKAEYHIDLRHDYIQILSESLNDDQVTALMEDMESLGFNCAQRRDDETKEWQLLIGLNDQERILKEAETQYIMVPRVYANSSKQRAKDERRERQKSYLPSLVRETEAKKCFVYDKRSEFCGGDFDKILNEAEKSRLIYIILDKIKLSQTPNFVKAMKDAKDVSHL